MGSDLTALLERVEKATGPDRELDGGICLHFGWTCEKMKGDARPYFREPGATEFYQRREPPHYTASIDAAMALVAEKLPGWNVTMAVATRTVAVIPDDRHSYGVGDPRTGHSRGLPTLPLAILAALLKALIAQQAKESTDGR